MNRSEIYTAIKAIRDGLSFEESGLDRTRRNIIEWEELKSEICTGYSIDLPYELRA